MRVAELNKVRHARHGAIVIVDLTNHTCGRQAGQTGKIDGGFRLAAALQDSAGAGAKRKDVTGSREVLRLTVRIDGRLDCSRAILSRYAG